jgi:hypothetical protein
VGKLPIIVALLSAGLASSAAAQSVCGAPRAVTGAVLHGPVLEIPNASTICIATGPSPAQWTAVSLAQLKTSRAVLMAAAFGQNVTCTIGPDGAGVCQVEGATLAQQVQRPEILKASLQWRDAPSAVGPTYLASR